MRHHSPVLASMTAALIMAACSIDTVNRPAEESGALTGTPISAFVQVPVASSGQEVSVRFVNAASKLFAVNACLRGVERRDGDTWVLQPAELRLCAPDVSVVAAQSERLVTTDVPSDAVAGEYRFRFSMAPQTGAAVDIVSSVFRVE